MCQPTIQDVTPRPHLGAPTVSHYLLRWPGPGRMWVFTSQLSITKLFPPPCNLTQLQISASTLRLRQLTFYLLTQSVSLCVRWKDEEGTVRFQHGALKERGSFLKRDAKSILIITRVHLICLHYFPVVHLMVIFAPALIRWCLLKDEHVWSADQTERMVLYRSDESVCSSWPIEFEFIVKRLSGESFRPLIAMFISTHFSTFKDHFCSNSWSSRSVLSVALLCSIVCSLFDEIQKT